MKDQYFGDINDYRKYGLLRALAGRGELDMCVAWMLTPNDEGRDGGFRTYLREPAKWRGCDPELYDFLASVLADSEQPRVSMIEGSSLLPGTTFIEEVVPDDRSRRRDWGGRLLEAAVGAELVFLDPDNGFEVRSRPVGRKGSGKYALWDEVTRLYEAGSSVLIYQHFCREERQAFVARLGEELGRQTGSSDVFAFGTPHVVFLLAAQPQRAGHFAGVVKNGLAPWTGQISASILATSSVPPEDEWHGIHLVRGSRLRLSNLTFFLDEDGNIVDAAPVQVSLSLDLYVYWLRIAIDHVERAELAHERLLETWDPQAGQATAFLEDEFSASMQAITAAAVAVDALYAVVREMLPIDQGTIDSWRSNRLSRPKQVAEVFRRAFLVGPKSFEEIRRLLIELYKWRDWCVHPPSGYRDPVRYDELKVATEWRFVAFRAENARNAVAIALSLIAQLLTRPRPKLKELAEHCEGVSPLMEPLVEEWETARGPLWQRDAEQREPE